MLIPMLKQLLEQGLLEGPKQAIEDAKTRIIFAVLGLIVGIVALTFIAALAGEEQAKGQPKG